MSGEFALEARGIAFGYQPDSPVLAGVSLGVRPGEIVAVIGPNGAGKTTLLNILAANLKPHVGEVLILGDPARSLSARERARRLAMVPQDPSSAFPFTALEIALMGRAPHLGRWQLEGKSDLGRAREALTLTGLSALMERRFHELSGGERQRVMIAKALAQDSKVLLMDEPTAFLDLRRQVEIYALVRRLARERGLAVLAVSHDINLAAAHCDRIVVLSEGRVKKDGPPREVLDPALLGEVYGVEVSLARHDDPGRAPLVFPVAAREAGKDGR